MKLQKDWSLLDCCLMVVMQYIPKYGGSQSQHVSQYISFFPANLQGIENLQGAKNLQGVKKLQDEDDIKILKSKVWQKQPCKAVLRKPHLVLRLGNTLKLKIC